MRPHCGTSSYDLECEISPKDLFEDIGSIIVEGRIPEFSKTGRRFGNHSWPVTNNMKKKCCHQEYPQELCKLVSQTRSKVSQIFEQRKKVRIELFCGVDDLEKDFRQSKDGFRIKINKFCTSRAVLLERWEICLIDSRVQTDCVNINMMLQAVRSYLHFSQLSSWWNVSQGVYPFHIYYRISPDFSDKEFILTEEAHKFPITQVSNKEYVQIHLKSLPRISKDQFTDLIRTKFKDFRMANISKDMCGIKRKDKYIDAYFSQHMRQTNCQTGDYVGEKLMRSSELSDTSTVDSSNKSIITSALSENLKKSSSNISSNFLSIGIVNKNTTLETFDKQDSVESKSGLSDLLEDFSIGNYQIESNINKCSKCMKSDCDHDEFDRGEITPEKQITVVTQPQVFRMRSKSTSPSFSNRQQQRLHGKPSAITKPVAVRRLAMIAGTVPIFHPKTGLPISSSPAPLKKPSTNNTNQEDNSLSRSASSEDVSSLMLSKSAPASTGLLGNFEESVLQARIPVDGTLQGFRAELGASGSFCPKHVSLPVKVQYFDFFDSSTLSPYLGHIYFSDKKLKRKRYRIPEKGTIQLTIFNPNKTVVKFFVVRYDFSDMPPLTKTFLRQKLVSKRENSVTMEEIQTVHYLIHLSFVSSKTRHIYLHTEIRVIFPQQAPDGRLTTVTDGPTNPKYTPIPSKYNRLSSGDEII